MQTPSLPIQVSGASARPARARGVNAAAPDAGQFSQALSQQIAQRQNTPAPGKPAPAAKQAESAKPAPKQTDEAKSADAGSQADAPASADTGKAASASDAAGAQGEGADKRGADAATDTQGANPMADLMLLVASFNQPALAPAAAAAPAVATDTLTSARAAPAELATAAVALPAAALPDAAIAEDGAEPAAVTGFALPDTAAQTEPHDAAALTGLDKLKLAAGDTATDAKPDRAGAAAAPGARPAAAVAAPVVALHTRELAEPAALKDAAPAAPVSAQVQQASLALAPQASLPATDKIAARVGTPAWDNQVGQKIIWMVAGKEQSATLTLNPPDLGPMQVVLNVTNDQASVTFSAAQPEVRQALEDALPKLRDMMGENGIALGSATVNAGAQEQRQAQGEAGRGGAHHGRGNGRDGGGASEVVAGSTVRSGALGLVDTFA
ncbi:MAG: flagellar hook-length control protein FliK [Massilia sp.]